MNIKRETSFVFSPTTKRPIINFAGDIKKVANYLSTISSPEKRLNFELHLLISAKHARLDVKDRLANLTLYSRGDYYACIFNTFFNSEFFLRV